MPHSFSRSAGLAFVLAAVVLFIVSPACAAGLLQQAGGVVGGIYNWYTLAPGRSVEWIFHYPGNNDAALIAFGVDPANSIGVNVYDDGQWQALGAGDTSVVPVGRGTPGTLDKWSDHQDMIDNGSLFWEARARPAVIFHIHVTNTSQGPSRYWIAQAGPGAGELAPWAPVAVASPTPQPTAVAPAPAARTPPPQPAAVAQTPTSAAGAQPSQPPRTLPITGSASLILSLGVGGVLVAAGWLARRRVHRDRQEQVR